jgi:hypothetical protein
MNNFKTNIYNKILLEKDSNVKKEMEKRFNELNCLYCFDIKTVWDYRSKEHQTWSKLISNYNIFYVSSCENCGTHEFLFDTNNINQENYTEYKRFKKNDSSVESRIKELKNVSQNLTKTNINNNEVTTCINNEKPSYEVESNFFQQNISGISFSSDVKKICEILSGVLQTHIGIPNINLINKIELSFQMKSKNQQNEQVFYYSTEDNKFFTFILIKDKDGNIFSIFNGKKHLLEIECYYWIYKAKNSAAIDILLKKQQDAVDNELISMTQMLDLHYNQKTDG